MDQSSPSHPINIIRNVTSSLRGLTQGLPKVNQGSPLAQYGQPINPAELADPSDLINKIGKILSMFK